MIPTSDFSNVFNKKYLEKVFPTLLTDLMTNSSYDRVIAELCPQGVDVNGKAVFSVTKGKPDKRKTYANTIDNVNRITWSLSTKDNIKLGLSLVRYYDIKYISGTVANSYQNSYIHIMNDQFFLEFTAYDLTLIADIENANDGLKKPISTVQSIRIAYSSGDFDTFCGTLCHDLYAGNGYTIQKRFAAYKKKYNTTRNLYQRAF